MTQTPQRCHGGHKESEEPVAVESTLGASFDESLALVTAAAAAVAGEGTVAVTLTWETGAVYKHGATNYIQR